MSYDITIPGKPMGKQRPRIGKFGVYAPKETVSYENLVKVLFVDKYGQPALTGCIRAFIDVYYEISKSTSKKKTEAMLGGEILPDKKPDCDNIAKIILDSLNAIAYKDDKQVVELVVTKKYAESPCVNVRLEVI